MSLKIKIMKFKLKYLSKLCSPLYFTDILRKEGIKVGEHTIFYEPFSQTIDRQRSWMLKIGDYCKITKGCTILTHDYSRSVLRRAYHETIGEAGCTSIGDNVFIGMNSTILMGSTIGNNVIIGAGSVVSGKIPDNCVAAGNPAKVIRSLDDHYKLRKDKTLGEARLYANTFHDEYGRYPTVREMGPFYPLFLERSKKIIEENEINIQQNGDDDDEILNDFLRSKGVYENYEDFLKYLMNI